MEVQKGIQRLSYFPCVVMNRYARAWNAFICANILPSLHAHEVTVERARLLWGILNEEYYVDLGEYIYQGILKFLRGKSQYSIPYASIVVTTQIQGQDLVSLNNLYIK